jgi:tetratricopeptide (TPR) repeat protein
MSKLKLIRMNGSSRGKIELLDNSAQKEIFAGREESCAIKFDADMDDLVSRRHLKISASQSCASGFTVTDLGSRNGTFVNKQRITSPTCLQHMDVLQLGAGGPELQVELEQPTVVSGSRPTRLAIGEDLTAPRLTREAALPSISSPRGVGRLTVERMLGENFFKVKQESAKTMWVAIGGIAAVLLVGVGLYLYLDRTSTQSDVLARQQQILLQQMNQQVKSQPAETDQMKAQIARLGEQLQKAQEENKRDLGLLMKQAAPSSTQPASTPQPGPTKAATQADSYNQQLQAAVDNLTKGNLPDTLRICSSLVKLDPQRWEAYALAGRTLHAANRDDQARTFLLKAKELAPEPTKPAIDQLLAQLGAPAQPQQPQPPAQPVPAPTSVIPAKVAPSPPEVARSPPPSPPSPSTDDDDKEAKIADLQHDYGNYEIEADAIENSDAEYRPQCTGMLSAICMAHLDKEMRKAREDRQQMEKIRRQLAALGASPDSN